MTSEKNTPARRALGVASMGADIAGSYKVYPPEKEKQHQLFDFGDATFLRDYLRESKNLFRTKGVLTEFIFMGRAEMGLYQTLHRLRARVLTSQIVRKYL